MQKFCQLIGILQGRARGGHMFAKVPFSQLNYKLLRFFENKGLLFVKEIFLNVNGVQEHVLVKIIYLSGRSGLIDWNIISRPSNRVTLKFIEAFRNSTMGYEFVLSGNNGELFSSNDLKQKAQIKGGVVLLKFKKMVRTKG
jgi:ribosomal protein S8